MDKEQIIVDGVDVNECPALCCGKTCFLSQHYSFTNPKYKIFCEENQNCDHKQLARKTQELEQYKTSKQASYEALQKQCNELELQNRKLKQECEALKSESFTREELITIQEKDIDRCRKALEEIEKISHYGTFKCVDCAGFNCKACTKGQFEIILDIINRNRGM